MNLAATMTLDSAGFVNPLRSAMGALRGLIALTGASLGVAGAVAGLRSALGMGGELSELRDRTGAAVKDLVLLRQAFEDTGVGADALPTAIQYMQRSLSGLSEEGKPTLRTFKALGLDMKALAGLTVPEQFERIGAAVRGLGNQADRTEAAMTIFGRSGASMLQLFADPAAIEKARAALGSLPDTLERNASLMDELDDAFGRLRTQGRGFFVGIAAELMPALNSLVTSLNGIDLTAIGKQVGEVLSILIEAFSQGKLGDLIGLSIGAGLKAAMMPLASGTFWKGLAEVAIGALAKLGAFLIEIFQTPLSYLQAGVDWIVGKLQEGIAAGLKQFTMIRAPKNSMFGFIQEQIDKIQFVKGPTWEEALKNAQDNNVFLNRAQESKTIGADVMAQGGALVAQSFKDAREAVTPEKEALGRLVADLKASVQARKDALSATVKAPTSPTAGALVSPESKRRQQPEDVDRWARIGMFVGQGGGPALDYQRRTATATEQSRRVLERLAKQNERGLGGPVAVWA